MTLYMTHPRRAQMQRYFNSDRVARNIDVHSDVHIPVDIKEEQDAFVVIATLPGLEAEDLNIEIIENVVNISGEFKTELEENENYLHCERPVGKFHRHLHFSTKLEFTDADATLKNGILTLRVSKIEEERPKTIKVKTK